MIENNVDFEDPGNCPGCNQALTAYRYDCVRWNGAAWHTSCALIVADRLLDKRNQAIMEYWKTGQTELLQEEGCAIEMNNWTQELPTQDGWYWVYYPETRPHVHMVSVYRGLVDAGEGIDDIPPVYAKRRLGITHWLGPLPKPEPPQEN